MRIACDRKLSRIVNDVESLLRAADIMRWCGEALDRVQVAWQQSNRNTLSVSRRADVARLTELIGVKA